MPICSGAIAMGAVLPLVDAADHPRSDARALRASRAPARCPVLRHSCLGTRAKTTISSGRMPPADARCGVNYSTEIPPCQRCQRSAGQAFTSGHPANAPSARAGALGLRRLLELDDLGARSRRRPRSPCRRRRTAGTRPGRGPAAARARPGRGTRSAPRAPLLAAWSSISAAIASATPRRDRPAGDRPLDPAGELGPVERLLDPGALDDHERQRVAAARRW